MCSLIGSVKVKESGGGGGRDLKPWARECKERGASAVLLIHVAISGTRDYLKGRHPRARGEETAVCARDRTVFQSGSRCGLVRYTTRLRFSKSVAACVGT